MEYLVTANPDYQYGSGIHNNKGQGIHKCRNTSYQKLQVGQLFITPAEGIHLILLFVEGTNNPCSRKIFSGMA